MKIDLTETTSSRINSALIEGRRAIGAPTIGMVLTLVIRVQPDEGVTVRFGSKVPGTSMEVRDVTMDFAYGESFTESSPEAYERLILDVLLGDANLFPRHQEVELSWNILDPIEAYWAENGKPAQYAAGSWGPAEADEMLARDGRSWRRP